MQQAHPRARVELWCMDEHRVGLKPILRRAWVRKGTRPRVMVHQRFECLYLYAFVCPDSGQVEWLLLPTVNVEIFTLALEHFAHAVGAGADKRVLLVLDQAGWHIGQDVRVPEGIHLIFLPPYSPELQPAERLWPLSNEGVADRHFPNLDAFEAVQVDRCAKLQQQPELIRSLTLFHWWPRFSNVPLFSRI